MTKTITRARAPGRVRRWPLVTGFALLLLAAVAAIVGTLDTAEADRWLSHSSEVRQAESELLSAIQDAETGQRGYLLTGDSRYLGPFQQGIERVGPLEARLRRLTADNPDQQATLVHLEGLVAGKVKELVQTIDLRKQGRQDQALSVVRSDLGRDLMLEIRVSIAQFDSREVQLLEHRRAVLDTQRAVLIGVILFSLALAAVLATLVAAAALAYESELVSRNAALAAEMERRERAESALRQAQKMEALGQLTGGVAHDFNNVLAIIIGSLDLILSRLGQDESFLRRHAENALKGSQRAASLTRRLLAFSRQQPLSPQPTDTNKCVGDTSEMLRRIVGEEIVIETVLAGGVWPAFVDAPQLESAILNLAVNARDAMPEGGKLTLETSNASLDATYAEENAEVAPGQYVLVAVTDSGGGMSQGVAAKAFEPFFTTKPSGAGAGLGLSQVHGFAKQSRGHVKIYSEVGVGTTVKLYLPRDLSGRPPEARKTEIPEQPDRRGVRVLVVEDDPGVRAVTISILKNLSYEVLEADSAANALLRLEQHPDTIVMLTDVVMPLTDGRQLADAARQRHPGLLVLFMTGYSRNAIVHNGVLDAGVHLVTKPFTATDLERELRLLLKSAAPDRG